MQRKLQRKLVWALNIKKRTMNIYQCHLIGRAKGHRTFSDFALQTKVRWSKNVRSERWCLDQIILGANDPSWCVLVHMAVS